MTVIDVLFEALVLAASPMPFDLFTCICWVRKLRNGRGNYGCTPLPAMLMFFAVPFAFFQAWSLDDARALAHLWSRLPSMLLGEFLMVVFHVLLCYYIPVWTHRRWLASGPDLEKYPYRWEV